MRRLIIFGLAALAGCVNTSSPEFGKKTAEKCSNFGFSPGTTEYANCRMNLTMLQEQDNMRRKQNMARALNESVDDFNSTMREQDRRQWEAMQRQADRDAYMRAHQQPLFRPPIRCESRPTFGGRTETTCQ